MKSQKTNNRGLISKITARVMLIVLLLTSALGLSACIFAATIVYNWEVYSHDEFVAEIEKFNSVNDGFVNTFISFDLDDNEDISNKIYRLSILANKSEMAKVGFYDKICDDQINVEFRYYLRADIENGDHNEHAYKIKCCYKVVKYNFTKNDKIEIKLVKTHSCPYGGSDYWYEEAGGCTTSPEDLAYMIYNYIYDYKILVNEKKFACIHISSIEEASEEKLEEIVQMLMDSMVIINTEE